MSSLVELILASVCHQPQLWPSLERLPIDILQKLTDVLVTRNAEAPPTLFSYLISRVQHLRLPPSTALRVLPRIQSNTLSSLCLRGCSPLTDDGVHDVVAGCPTLTRIDLSYCPKLTISSLHFALALLHLETLIMERCLQVRGTITLSHPSLAYLNLSVDSNLQTIVLASTPSLRFLNLSGCSQLRYVIAQSPLPALEELHCLSCGNLEHIGEKFFAKCASTTLRLVDLFLATKLLANDITALATAAGHSLQYVNLSGCGVNDDALECLCRTCAHIRTLLLRDCAQLTTAGLSALARLRELWSVSLPSNTTNKAVVSIVRNCPAIECVELSYCATLSDATVAEILVQLPRLHVLSLCDSMQLTDVAMTPLTRGTTAEYLEYLNLQGCGRFTDAVLSAVAVGCPVLKTLDMSYSQRITSMGVAKVLAVLPLENLYIQGCELVDDAAFEPLLCGKQPPPAVCSLRKLDVYGCAKLGFERSIVPLVTQCTSLVEINVSMDMYMRLTSWLAESRIQRSIVVVSSNCLDR